MVSASENKPSHPLRLKAFLFWLPMVFIGMSNGVFRQLVLLNFLSEPSARQASSILLTIFLSVYTWLVYPRLQVMVSSNKSAFKVGMIWMSLTFIFETVLGYFVSHLTLEQIFSEYNIIEGKFWPFVLLALLFLPFIARAHYREHINQERSVGRRRLKYILGVILLIVAINALGGGYYGMVGAKDVPIEWLKGSPFESYFVPALILFVFIGLISLATAISIFSKRRFVVMSLLSGGILVIWIIIQVSVIGFVSWLQPIMFLAGLIILVLSRTLRGATVN